MSSEQQKKRPEDHIVCLYGNKYNLKDFPHPHRSLDFLKGMDVEDVTAIFEQAHGKGHAEKLEKLSTHVVKTHRFGDEKEVSSDELQLLDLDSSFFVREARHFNEITERLYLKSLSVSCDRTFRKVVDEKAPQVEEIISLVESGNLETEQLEDLHADLAFICGRYRGASKREQHPFIPRPLSTLWVKTSEALEREPIAEYADLVSFNTTLESHHGSQSGGIDTNIYPTIEPLRHFSGFEDEQNFYKQHINSEIIFFCEFYPLIKKFHEHSLSQDLPLMIETIREMNEALAKVSEAGFETFLSKVDPQLFFDHLRKFYSSVSEVEYEGYGKLKLGGASGAQSAIFSILDGLIELPQADEPLRSILKSFAVHRPLVQKKVIQEIEEKFGIRTPCIEAIEGFCDHEDKVDLLKAFNELVKKYAIIRRNHEKLIMDYVMKPSSKGKELTEKDQKEMQGTGGSPIHMMMERTAQIISQTITRTELGVDPRKDLLDKEEKEAEVNPYFVKGRVDYNKLVDQFGCQRITPELLERFLAVVKVRSSGKITTLHPLLERGIFYTHRDLEKLIERLEKEPEMELYIYTGRGPSGGMHLGHLLPFHFTQWLQVALDCRVVIQMTDDEKYSYRNMTLESVQEALVENVKDIIAVGFDPEKTFIFSNFQYVGTMYPLITSISRAVTTNQIKGLFGFDLSMNVGMFHFPCIQAAPSFSQAFPHLFDPKKNVLCLIPQAIDQDVYFRMTRDVAPVLKLEKPVLMHSKFFPALQGPDSKMSSSDPNSAIFLTDTPLEIKSKINKHAFSGGQATRALQEQYGANIDIDTAYQLLVHFHHDSEFVKDTGEKYATGKLLTGHVKNYAIELVQDVIKKHQLKRNEITDSDVERFMSFPSGIYASAI